MAKNESAKKKKPSDRTNDTTYTNNKNNIEMKHFCAFSFFLWVSFTL